MEQRLDILKAAPDAPRALLGVHKYLESCGLESELLHIIYLRASQINGCGFCTDMHWKDARSVGASEQKLAMLTVWWESPFFSERERAALAWTESVTLVAKDHVPDEVYRTAKAQFSDQELVNLTVAVGAINSWNRLGIAFRKEAGHYKAAKAAV